MIWTRKNWLDAVTSEDVFTSSEEVTGASTYVIQVTATGSPTSAALILQGSLDGQSWSNMQATIGLGMTTITGKPAKFIRLYVDQISGGTSPTLSASVMAMH